MEKVKIWVYIAAILATLSAAVSKNMKGSARYLSLLAIVGFAALLVGTSPALAATAPSLGTASSFAVLAGSAVTCTGSSLVGDVGVYPGTAITLTGCTVSGTLHPGDFVAATAQSDALNAYTALVGEPNTGTLSPTPGTQTLTQGVYRSTAAVTMTGTTLTLDGQGDSNAVFVFQINGALTMTSSQIVLVNGAQASNVFWQVTDAATLTTSTFVGTIIANNGAITATGTTANCGLLALNFAVTSTGSIITVCNDNVAPPVAPPQVTQGRMTGGGSVIDPTGTPNTRVTHGFELNCDVTKGHNNLQVNWGTGKFHMDSLTSVSCVNDPAIISPNPPDAGFNTYIGTGTGSYNGVSGATAIWIFTDAGEPGTKDHATIVIKDSTGATVLSISGNIDKGNQQAHKK